MAASAFGFAVTPILVSNFVAPVIIGVDTVSGNGGLKRLAVLGHHATTDAAASKWYWLEGDSINRDICQSGLWENTATSSGSGVSARTTFTLPTLPLVCTFQKGWLLQPDVNFPAFLPILNLDENSRTLTTAGAYADLAKTGSEATHFRIYAPPGIETHGWATNARAGVLSRWVGARSSRCLFGGYRFESPLAGFDSATFAGPGELQPMCRQSGYNFAGLHYTLHRHYDPRLMRFTSIDPAASPVYNLYAYSNNSPARFFYPDGLEKKGYALRDLTNDGLAIVDGVLLKSYTGAAQ